MKVKIGFTEQSKCTVCDVSIESESDAPDVVLAEAKRVYLQAQTFAWEQTMRKNR